MKRKGILVTGLLLFLATAGYSQVKSGAYRLMLKALLQHSVPEVGIRYAAGNKSDLVFLDTREPREYAVSHIDGAIYVGYDTFDLSKLASLDKNSRIVAYCSVGYRSEKIAEKLIAAGFKNVSNLYGGIFEWVNQGHAVHNDQGPTQEIHAYDRTWGIWLNRGKKVYE